jgi:hypothetical protein
MSAGARIDTRQNGSFQAPGLGQAQDPVEDGDDGKGKKDRAKPEWNSTLFKMFESAATTFASLAVLG